MNKELTFLEETILGKYNTQILIIILISGFIYSKMHFSFDFFLYQNGANFQLGSGFWTYLLFHGNEFHLISNLIFLYSIGFLLKGINFFELLMRIAIINGLGLFIYEMFLIFGFGNVHDILIGFSLILFGLITYSLLDNLKEKYFNIDYKILVILILINTIAPFIFPSISGLGHISGVFGGIGLFIIQEILRKLNLYKSSKFEF